MLSDLLMIAAAEFKYEPSKVEHSNPMLTKYEYKKTWARCTVSCERSLYMHRVWQQEISSSMEASQTFSCTAVQNGRV